MRFQLLRTTPFLALMLCVIPLLTIGASSVLAQQNCRNVPRWRNETWFDGQNWRTSRVGYSEWVCSGIPSGTQNGTPEFPLGYGITVSTPDDGPLNVYAEPSFDSPIVRTIPNGASLPLTGNIHDIDWFETMEGDWVYKHHAR